MFRNLPRLERCVCELYRNFISNAFRLQPDNAIARILSIIHEPFQDLLEVIDPTCPPSTLLSNLVSSSTSPLYTALVIFSPCTHFPHLRRQRQPTFFF